MLYKVNSNSNHCLFSELSSASVIVCRLELRPQLIRWCSKHQGVEHPKLQGVSCQPRLVCGITFPTLCLTPSRWMGLRKQSIVGCFPELCFPVFRGAGASGAANEIYNKFVFSNLRLC